MKTIPLQEACELLDKAIFLSLYSAGQDVKYNSWGMPDDEDDSFLFVSWRDEEHQEYAVQFLAKENQNVEIDEEKMILVAEDGKKETIGLVFEFVNIEKLIKDTPSKNLLTDFEAAIVKCGMVVL